jgi:hypothetical protein
VAKTREWGLAVLAVLAALAPASGCDGVTAKTAADTRAGNARIDVLARACARAASCAHTHDAPRFRDPVTCVENGLEHAEAPDEVSRCIDAASSCADVALCFHRAGDPRAAALCAAQPGTKTDCDGDALVSCAQDDPAESTLTPCAPLGAACGESHSAGGLVAHGCLTPSVCPPNVTRVRCDGDTALAACHDEILEKVACQPGKTCHAHLDEDGEEAATCEGAAEAQCGTVGQRACRGSVLVDCVAHGHHAREVSVDCAALGLVCGDSRGRAACLAARADCVAGATTCEGGALGFCAAGRRERIACSEVGLGPCNTPGRGPVGLCGPGVPVR